MIIREHEVPYGLGTVVVRDYGGDGPDVLLVHAPGFCAAAWDNVAESLKGDVHAYAIDLPGHGRSTAPMRRATTPGSLFWRSPNTSDSRTRCSWA